MLVTTIWWGGCDTYSITIFFELLNIVHENDYLDKKI